MIIGTHSRPLFYYILYVYIGLVGALGFNVYDFD